MRINTQSKKSSRDVARQKSESTKKNATQNRQAATVRGSIIFFDTA